MVAAPVVAPVLFDWLASNEEGPRNQKGSSSLGTLLAERCLPIGTWPCST